MPTVIVSKFVAVFFPLLFASLAILHDQIPFDIDQPRALPVPQRAVRAKRRVTIVNLV